MVATREVSGQDDLVGKAVIIEHPAFHDRHVVALVESQSLRTLSLRYWDGRRQEWKEETARRKVQMVVCLPSADAAHVQAVYDKLLSLGQELAEEKKAAEVRYKQSLQAFGSANA